MFHSTDNSISEIQGLSSCHRLTHLSLMNNNISRIANLDNLPLKSLDLVGTLNCYILLKIQMMFMMLCQSYGRNPKVRVEWHRITCTVQLTYMLTVQMNFICIYAG